MYMDDGLMTNQNTEYLKWSIAEFEGVCAEIGVELSKEKSRWVKRDGEWLVDKLKFLGLEYWPDSDKLVSNTRSGTMKEIPRYGDIDLAMEIKARNPYLDFGYMSAKELDEVINTKAFEAGVRYGFLGCLITDAMDPNPKTTLATRSQEVREGQIRSWENIQMKTADWVAIAGYDSSPYEDFMWKFQDLYQLARQEWKAETADILPVSLTNTSSLMCASFLVRGIRERVLSTRRAKRRRRGQIGATYANIPSEVS